MQQLDPFIIYTVKLAMDFKSTVNLKDIEDEKMLYKEKPVVDCSQKQDMFPNTIQRIMYMKPLIHRDSHTVVPKLRRENILSLLYHADEQWISSIQELNEKEIKDFDYAVDLVHRQQRIYLDTLYLLHNKTMTEKKEPKRFNEPVWFAAQVLYHQCQIRHLESFTDRLLPFATSLYQSMHQLRTFIYQLCQKQHRLKQTYAHKEQRSFFHYFFSDSRRWDHHQNFYASEDNLTLISSITPVFNEFIHHWSVFEKLLYECYVQAVFGKQYYLDHMESKPLGVMTIPHMPYQYDTFTQILPIVLDRAIHHRRLFDIQDIQSLEPLAFVALPRLAILAGITWLSHLTGWRHGKQLPHWLNDTATLHGLMRQLEELESRSLQARSHHAHHHFVTMYQALEHSLVYGMDPVVLSSHLEKQIYLNICLIADSILSSCHAKSFNRVLCCLFKYSGEQTNEFEYDDDVEDAVPIEQTVLHLAI